MKMLVKTLNDKYDIIIENNALDCVSDYFNLERKVLIITDDNIPLTYINKVKNKCLETYVFTIKNGEESKNIDNLSKILNFMIENNFTRTDAVIAIGGGVVGDIAALSASLYMRGIDFYNIPTSLLASLDSSIGGKTAIDFGGIKNSVGTFYQPKCVLIDPLTLSTLDKRQFYSGLVEGIKMALCFDKDLFEYIESCDDISKNINEIIYRSLLIKKYVVENDEKEKSLRKVLNFGHTFGHAIEEAFLPKYLHGECVGMGMLYFASEGVKVRLIKLLKRFNLPLKVNISFSKLKEYIKHDKKASSNKISIIYVENIGSFEIREELIDDLVKYVGENI